MFFFFPPPLGNPLQTGRSYECSHLTSAPDVGSQGQPVRQGLLLVFHSHQAKQNCKPNPPHFMQSQSCTRNTWQQQGCYRWSRTHCWDSIHSTGSVQPGQASSELFRDAGGPHEAAGTNSYTKWSFLCSWSNFRFSHMEEKYRTLHFFFFHCLSEQRDAFRRCKLYSQTGRRDIGSTSFRGLSKQWEVCQ